MISLRGQRILVTREAQGAKRLAEQISFYGGEPIVTPLLEIKCLPVRENLKLHAYDWVFFTSQNGVNCFVKHASFSGQLSGCRIAAVGTKTAEAIGRAGYDVDFIPSTYNAKVMADEFLAAYDDAGPILLVRGVRSRTVLADALAEAGRTYANLTVYDTVIHSTIKKQLTAVLSKQSVDMLTFTSPSAIDAFIELVGDIRRFKHLPVACIGTTTEKYARDAGFKRCIVPEQFTVEDMLKAMSDFLN